MPRKKVERSIEIVPDLKLVFAPKNDEQKQMLKVIEENMAFSTTYFFVLFHTFSI